MLTFLLLFYLDFFHFISVRIINYFLFIIYEIFFVAFLDFIIFIFIITHLYWYGLFTKKEFILSLSCASGAIAVSFLNIQRLIEVKISTAVSPIWTDSLLWWLLFACTKVMALLEVSCLEFWLYLCSCSNSFKRLLPKHDNAISVEKLDFCIYSKIQSNPLRQYEMCFTEPWWKFLNDTYRKESNFYGLPKIQNFKIIESAIKTPKSKIIKIFEPNDLKLRPIVSSPN